MRNCLASDVWNKLKSTIHTLGFCFYTDLCYIPLCIFDADKHAPAGNTRYFPYLLKKHWGQNSTSTFPVYFVGFISLTKWWKILLYIYKTNGKSLNFHPFSGEGGRGAKHNNEEQSSVSAQRRQ